MFLSDWFESALDGTIQKKQRGYSTIHMTLIFSWAFCFFGTKPNTGCVPYRVPRQNCDTPPTFVLPFDRNLLSVMEYVTVFIHDFDVIFEQSHAGQCEKKDRAYFLISSTTTTIKPELPSIHPASFPVPGRFSHSNSMVGTRSYFVAQ